MAMSIQIAVRLPEELVSFLDKSVADGEAPSRASLVVAALEREQRARAAMRDADLLRSRGAADDLDPLVDWTVANISVAE
jgi:Arc/MetJ-type ribon-helix-helix transcriptional regulator